MFSRLIKLIQVSKILLSLSLVTSLSLLFPAQPYAQKTIKIGVGLDLTGPLSVFGVNIHHAMRIAIDDINAKGGALGKKVDLLVFDTQSKSEYRLDLIKIAILKKKVAFLIGPFGLRSVNPAFLSEEKNVLHNYKIPMVIFKSNIPYPQPHRYIFQISPDILMQGYAVSNWAGHNTNLKKYVSIGPKVFNDFFTQSIEHLLPNMKDLKDFIPDYKTVDFSSYISHIFQIKPDIIISTLKGIQLEAFLKQSIARSLFQNIKFIGNFDASFLAPHKNLWVNICLMIMQLIDIVIILD
ncbi:MAG: ABC transporter substrate-binding protein [Deltaproteobacteria bacterium]|nr:ABC transporter substrate-binding protein [Deltaproteobacteria bacterium]